MHVNVVRGPVLGGSFELREGDNVAGRGPECDICLPSKRVSRQHCVFTLADGRVFVRDLGSHNGIVDAASGRRVGTLVLAPGGRVQVGDYLLSLEVDTTDALLEDDDDDVFIATSEIEAPPGGWTEDDDDEGSGEELSLDDTASAIRAAAVRGPWRAPAGRDATQPRIGQAQPWQPQPRSGPLAARRPAREATAPRIDTRADARPRGGLPDDAPTPRPGALLLDEPTPRPQSLNTEAWMRARAPVAEEATTAPPGPRRVRGGDAVRAELARAEQLRAEVSEPARPEPPRAEVHRVEPSPRGEAPPRRGEPPRIEQRNIPRPEPVWPPLPSGPPRAPRAAPRPAPASPGGVPWALQAVTLFMLLLALVVCTPFGGLAGQVLSRIDLAEEASVARGVEVAHALAARNAAELAAGGTSFELSLATSATGVREARVTDARGVVLAPANKARMDMSPFPAFAQAMSSGDAATALSPSGSTEVVVPVRTAAGSTVVGYAWLDYDPAPHAATLDNPWVGAFGALVVAGGVALTLLVGLWWLAARPVEALAAASERLASGRVDAVRAPTRSEAWEQISGVLNELAARAPRDEE